MSVVLFLFVMTNPHEVFGSLKRLDDSQEAMTRSIVDNIERLREQGKNEEADRAQQYLDQQLAKGALPPPQMPQAKDGSPLPGFGQPQGGGSPTNAFAPSGGGTSFQPTNAFAPSGGGSSFQPQNLASNAGSGFDPSGIQIPGKGGTPQPLGLAPSAGNSAVPGFQDGTEQTDTKETTRQIGELERRLQELESTGQGESEEAQAIRQEIESLTRRLLGQGGTAGGTSDLMFLPAGSGGGTGTNLANTILDSNEIKNILTSGLAGAGAATTGTMTIGSTSPSPSTAATNAATTAATQAATAAATNAATDTGSGGEDYPGDDGDDTPGGDDTPADDHGSGGDDTDTPADDDGTGSDDSPGSDDYPGDDGDDTPGGDDSPGSDDYPGDDGDDVPGDDQQQPAACTPADIQQAARDYVDKWNLFVDAHNEEVDMKGAVNDPKTECPKFVPPNKPDCYQGKRNWPKTEPEPEPINPDDMVDDPYASARG